MNKLVSIGIPVKNGFTNKSRENINLENVLDSILTQSYKNIEIIISNNCSTDKTNTFLENISKIDKRIKLFNQKEQILAGENFQFVKDQSKGDYFKWNCADDLISPDYIAENVKFLENNEDYIASSSKFYFENDKQNFYEYDLDQEVYNRIKFFFKIRYYSHNIFFSLMKKETAERLLSFSGDYLGIDWAINLDLLLRGKYKTIDKGHMINGTNGFSRSDAFLKRKRYNNKTIHKILPLYEMTRDFFKITILSKKLSFFQKIYLFYLCLKTNIPFLKKRSKQT